MNAVGGKGPPPTLLHGSSFESFEDAATQALRDGPGSWDRRVADVMRLRVETVGIEGRIRYHVDLLVPEESDAAGTRPSAGPPPAERADAEPGAAPRGADTSRLEQLPPELRSRVLAATAHAGHRFITGPGPQNEYEVHAFTGDRFVHMLLSMRPDGSVDETTETLLRHQIVGVEVEQGHGRIEVEEASERRSIPVPVGLAEAFGALL
jgi:hypothetical protein